ncbi:MAG: glutamate dehydrogenase, partial [Gammaproteobacteria bacterium]|nr:glutamate dehydrogenase [Gammaproteobacteria bacterium]
PDCLDPLDVMQHKQDTGSVMGARTYGKAQELTNADLLEQECDVLIPAAMEHQITSENAPNVKAKVILELANGPISPGGDKNLYERGIVVIPDILANAGGVTVSYFEWVQNKAGFYWELEDIHARLRRRLEPEAIRLWNLSNEKGIDMRTSAYMMALERLNAAVAAHGTRAYFCS